MALCNYHGPGPCPLRKRRAARGTRPEGSKELRSHTVQKITSHAHAQKRKSFFWFRRVSAQGGELPPKPDPLAMEKWQLDGFDSFGEWRRADQKRRDDAKKAARAAAAPLPPPPLRAVALAMPVAADARDVCVLASCPGSTCSGHGTAHVHHKRVRLAAVPMTPVVGQLATPIMPTTVTLTDPEAQSPPRRQLQKSGELLEHVEVTPGGSRMHHLERTTPRGTQLTAQYKSPKGVPDAGVSWERSRDAYQKLRLSDASRSALACKKRKAGIPPALHAQRQPRLCEVCGENQWRYGMCHCNRAENYCALCRKTKNSKAHVLGTCAFY
jgi:hypothetical protein